MKGVLVHRLMRGESVRPIPHVYVLLQRTRGAARVLVSRSIVSLSCAARRVGRFCAPFVVVSHRVSSPPAHDGPEGVQSAECVGW